MEKIYSHFWIYFQSRKIYSARAFWWSFVIFFRIWNRFGNRFICIVRRRIYGVRTPYIEFFPIYSKISKYIGRNCCFGKMVKKSIFCDEPKKMEILNWPKNGLLSIVRERGRHRSIVGILSLLSVPKLCNFEAYKCISWPT